MKRQLNPLEKEFLLQQFKKQNYLTMSRFCETHQVCLNSFRAWQKAYNKLGIDGLIRKVSRLKDVLPHDFDRSEEKYKQEIIRLRIENERFKKNYMVEMKAGKKIFIHLKPKNTRS